MTTAITLNASLPEENTMSTRNWIALLGSLLGAFMAVLDIQITNASLNDILGSLAATLDEGSWISTSYLVAEIIIIPLTAWLTQVFSLKRYLVFSTALFMLSSAACAWSWNLESMIVFRAAQGITGGALIPIAFSLVLKLLPMAKRPLGFALFGITATFAPAIGPTVGGWLTEAYGWPSIFYLNLVPGTIMLGALIYGLDKDPMDLSMLRRFDGWGIGTMTIGLGSLIVFLEEGNRNLWFESSFITTLATLSATSLIACVIIELVRKEPFINLRLFKDRNFAMGSLVNMAFGVGMYGLVYLLPLYLAQTQGYNAQQIGVTMIWNGLPQLLMMPVAAALAQRIESRLLVTFGLAMFAASCFMNGFLTNLTAYDQLKVSQVLRALGAPFIMVPLTGLATNGIAAAQSGSASALFNMLRNLGGSISIALLATQLDLREKFHSVRLGESINVYAAATRHHIEAFTQHFISLGSNAITAKNQALAALMHTVRRESNIMAFSDAFLLVGAVLTSMIALVWLCRPVKGSSAGGH